MHSCRIKMSPVYQRRRQPFNCHVVFHRN